MASLASIGSDNRPHIDVDWTGPHMSAPTTVSQVNQDFVIDTGATLSAITDPSGQLKLSGAARQKVVGVGGSTQIPMSGNVTLTFDVTDPRTSSRVTESYTGSFLNTTTYGAVSVIGMDVLCTSSGRRLCLTLDVRSSTGAVSLQR